MPTVVVENVPPEVYERLQQRAAAERRSLPDVTLHLLKQALRAHPEASPRWPDFVSSEEVPAPCDLPRSSSPVVVGSYRGEPRSPDPIPEETSESEAP